jgi:hypothetical protein
MPLLPSLLALLPLLPLGATPPSHADALRPSAEVRFDPRAIARLDTGDALPAGFDELGARGLRVVARTQIGPAISGDAHLALEHATIPGRHASLLLRGGRLTGAIYLGDQLRVALTGLAPGVSTRATQDANHDLPCGADQVAAPPAGRATNGGDGGVAGGCDDGSRVDVFVHYTDAAVVQAGGETQMVDWIHWAIADSNAIYASTGIPLTMRLVGTSRAVGYTEDAGSMLNDLYALRDPADGRLDEALPLRNQTGADFVALVRADGGGACGIAWLLGADPALESYGYSVTALGCFTNRTFTHELGHNMGCCHAPGDGGGCLDGGAFPYSVGHRFTGAGGAQYRTVMAYAPGTRIPRFSSPGTIYDGTPTGLVDRDNGASITALRTSFANFRCEVCEGDLNGDGVRDGADLAVVLDSWGAGSTAGDVNADGNTDGADLAVLLGVWGSCP